MIGFITSYLAGVRVNGSIYRVEHAPDGPSSPVWLSEYTIGEVTCACCGELLVDFNEELEEIDDESRCLNCGDLLGYENDSDFCDEDCAQAHSYASMF